MSNKNGHRRQMALLSVGLSSGIAATAFFLRRLWQRPLPEQRQIQIVQGIQRSVEVIRDSWGIPHIYAHNEEDLFFAQGYVHAQDRLFQMDVNRRVGSGRISEVVGSIGIDSDRFARTFNWHRAAQAQTDSVMQDEETWRLAQAYSAGVNAYIEQNHLPVEFLLFRYKPEPWKLYDSALWGTVLAWGLSVNWQTELLRAQMIEELGPEKAAELTPTYHDDYLTIIPEAVIGKRLAHALLDAYRRAVEQLPLGHVPASSGVGSNNWVVDGRLTASGRPILANDPHLPPIFPTIWYENHLIGGRFNVTGFTSPGVPGVIIGHNDRIAWGLTNAFPDVQDIYVERFHPDNPLLYEVDGTWVEAEQETARIYVRGRRQPVVEQIRTTRHGPVISGLIEGEHRDLSLRWISHDQNNQLRAILQLCLASDWQSFRSALADWSFPSQNIVYADAEGHIGYFMPGRIPRRSAGLGLVPVPGWTSEYEWTGWIPFEELPNIQNPAQGYIVTANNHVVGDNYPHFLTGEWLPPYRAQRIATLIQELAPLDVEKNARIQNDTVSLLTHRFTTLALAHLDSRLPTPDALSDQALSLLRQWNGDMRAELVAPTIAYGWLVQFTRAALQQGIGLRLAEALLQQERLAYLAINPFHEIAHELSLRWLAGKPPSWVGDVRSLLAPALHDVLALLRETLGPELQGWAWGRLHYVEFRNFLARIPALGRLWKPVSYPIGGDGYSVNQADVALRFPPDPVHIIASCRMIIDVGAWDNSVSSLPGGQSGHPASKHYQDSIEDWLQGRYHPMLYSQDRIKAAEESRLILQPGDIGY